MISRILFCLEYLIVDLHPDLKKLAADRFQYKKCKTPLPGEAFLIQKKYSIKKNIFV